MGKAKVLEVDLTEGVTAMKYIWHVLWLRSLLPGVSQKAPRKIEEVSIGDIVLIESVGIGRVQSLGADSLIVKRVKTEFKQVMDEMYFITQKVVFGNQFEASYEDLLGVYELMEDNEVFRLINLRELEYVV